MQLNFTCVPFHELTPYELYDMLALRQEVFVVEQNCAYLDTDGKDLHSYHLMVRDEAGTLVACTRLLPKGLSYPEYASIGRVVNSSKVRGLGVGKQLMEKSIELCRHLFNDEPIKIGARRICCDFTEVWVLPPPAKSTWRMAFRTLKWFG